MTRNQLHRKMKINAKKIQALSDANKELNRKWLLLTDKRQQYTEQEETFGRGKNKITHLIGRVHWKEFFADEDTGQKIAIDRSCVVRQDGEWINGY